MISVFIDYLYYYEELYVLAIALQVWKSEDNVLELVTSLYLYVGSMGKVQVARLMWQVSLPIVPSGHPSHLLMGLTDGPSIEHLVWGKLSIKQRSHVTVQKTSVTTLPLSTRQCHNLFTPPNIQAIIYT